MIKHAFIASLITMLSFLVIAGSDLSRLNAPPFPDEMYTVSAATLYPKLFVRGDYQDPRWKHLLGFTQPHLGSYLLAFAFATQGLNEIVLEKKDLNNAQNPDFRTLLPVARTTMALVGAGAVGLLYLIALNLGGMVTALSASALLITNPIFLNSARQAYLDAPLALTTLLTILTMLIFSRLIRSDYRYAASFGALAVGIAIGLAASSRINGALLAVVFLIVVPLLYSARYPYSPSRFRMWRVLLRSSASLLLAGISSIAIFILLNPLFYSEPWSAASAMWNHRLQESLHHQTTLAGGLLTYGQRVAALAAFTLFDPSTPLSGVLPQFPILCCLFLLGVASTLKVIFSNADSSSALLLLTWLAVSSVSTTIYVSMPWERYFLPALIPTILFQATGLTALFRVALISELSPLQARPMQAILLLMIVIISLAV